MRTIISYCFGENRTNDLYAQQYDMSSREIYIYLYEKNGGKIEPMDLTDKALAVIYAYGSKSTPEYEITDISDNRIKFVVPPEVTQEVQTVKMQLKIYGTEQESLLNSAIFQLHVLSSLSIEEENDLIIEETGEQAYPVLTSLIVTVTDQRNSLGQILEDANQQLADTQEAAAETLALTDDAIEGANDAAAAAIAAKNLANTATAQANIARDQASARATEAANVDADLTKLGNVLTLTVTNRNGIEREETIIEPTITTTKQNGVATLEITDGSGTNTVYLYDGNGSVNTVEGVYPDENGNVTLPAVTNNTNGVMTPSMYYDLQRTSLGYDLIVNGVPRRWVIDSQPAQIIPTQDEFGYPIEHLVTSTGIYNAIEAAKTHVLFFTATLDADDWVNGVQTVNVQGMLSSYYPFIEIDGSDISVSNSTEYLDCLENWSLVSRAVAGNGTITAYCYGDVPTSDIPIMIKVVE